MTQRPLKPVLRAWREWNWSETPPYGYLRT